MHYPIPDTYIVKGTVLITHGAVVHLDASNFEMMSGAQFVIENGSKLILDQDICKFYSYDQHNMWDGIYIEGDDSYFHSEAAHEFYDAVNAIVSDDGGVFEIAGGNIFDKNERALVVNDYNGDHQGYFEGNYNGNLSYEIYSLDGRMVLDGNINNKSRNNININHLENGVYFVKLLNDFEIVYNAKFIKN